MLPHGRQIVFKWCAFQLALSLTLYLANDNVGLYYVNGKTKMSRCSTNNGNVLFVKHKQNKQEDNTNQDV